MAKINFDPKAMKEVARAPAGGRFGQISFSRLVEELRATGNIRPEEKVTHLEFDGDSGFLKFKVE